MKIVFVSNYYNHHQAPLSEEFYRQTDGNYFFIQTMPMEAERLHMGWGQETLPPFVIESYKDETTYQKCLNLIDSADVVITGSAPEKMIRHRIRQGKLVFRYSERIYKNPLQYLTLPLRFFKYHFDNFPSKKVYLLCASAYAAGDYAKTGNFIGKTYQWGYFPKVTHYDDIDKLIEAKEPASILWVGRLIGLKHPEVPIEIARRLKKEGYTFDLKMIGCGKLEGKLKDRIEKYDLSDCVHLMGAMKPEEVRSYMEKSQIFLFTSDRNEGWGAVLNESMNSACAVVACDAIGSVPYLLKDGENGFTYRYGDDKKAYQRVKSLLDHSEICKACGFASYHTMAELWNPHNGAKRFISLAKNIENSISVEFYSDGPCDKS